MCAGNNVGNIYQELQNSDRTTQSQSDFYCHHAPMIPNCVMENSQSLLKLSHRPKTETVAGNMQTTTNILTFSFMNTAV